MVEIVKIVIGGFGSIFGYIGIVIVFGIIIGVIFECSGVVIIMVESVICLFGECFLILIMLIIGYLVLILVFCDFGFVIFNLLKNVLVVWMKIFIIVMSVVLVIGFYVIYIFVLLILGLIVVVGNFGLDVSFGLVIVVGLVVVFVIVMVGMWWVNCFVGKDIFLVDDGQVVQIEEDFSELCVCYGKLFSVIQVFVLIFVLILLICFGLVVVFLSKLLGEGVLFVCLNFFG